MRILFLACLTLLTLAAGAVTPFEQSNPLMVVTIRGKGEIHIRLRADKAPKTVARISELAKSGFYNNQKFHKVVRDPRPFLIQVGDPESKTKPVRSVGDGGSGRTIAYENSGLRNKRGAVGLAAPPDNRDGGDSQFYVLLGDYAFLDGSYTVFGTVEKGMDVADKVQMGDLVESATIRGG